MFYNIIPTVRVSIYRPVTQAIYLALIDCCAQRDRFFFDK